MVRARQNLAVSQRYYDPVIGRYISRDPIGYGDGPNVYLYTHNNPINGIDPLGLEAEPQWHHRVGKTPFADNVVDHPELWKDGKVGKIEKTKKEGYRVAQGELLIDANDKKYGTMLHPDDHSQLAGQNKDWKQFWADNKGKNISPEMIETEMGRIEGSKTKYTSALANGVDATEDYHEHRKMVKSDADYKNATKERVHAQRNSVEAHSVRLKRYTAIIGLGLTAIGVASAAGSTEAGKELRNGFMMWARGVRFGDPDMEDGGKLSMTSAFDSMNVPKTAQLAAWADMDQASAQYSDAVPEKQW